MNTDTPDTLPPVQSGTDKNAHNSAEPPGADTADALTQWLPPALHHPVHQLAAGAGLDATASIVLSVELLGAWAGDRLKVKADGDLKVSCACSCVVGIPAAVSPERVDAALFDAVAGEEAKMVAQFIDRFADAQHDRLLVSQRRLRPGRARSFLRNPEARVATAVSRATYSDELLIGFTGDGWFLPLMDGPRSNDAWLHVATFFGRHSRRTRLQQPGRFRTADNPEVVETRHSLIATVNADLLRQFSERSWQHRVHLYGANYFNAPAGNRADPSLRVISEESADAWRSLLKRATSLRAGEEERLVIPTPEANEAFAKWHQEIEALWQRIRPEDAYFLRSLHDLPLRLYGILHFAAEDSAWVATTCLPRTMQLAYWIRDRMVALHEAGAEVRRSQGWQSKTDSERILAKVVERGPLTRRQLLRSEHVQKWSHHSDTVCELLRKKLIKLDQWGRYCAVPAPSGGANQLPASHGNIR